MKKRYLYMLLFGMPGLFIAGILSIAVFGGVMGVLWLYVFGDDPWPAHTEQVVSILFVASVLLLWLVFIGIGYALGRRLETSSDLNRRHVAASVALTVLFLLLILFQQWSTGAFGPKSAAAACSTFCLQHGYAGSGVSPQGTGEQTCSCYDDSGNEVMRVLLDRIAPDAAH